jgi:hypothetical protein
LKSFFSKAGFFHLFRQMYKHRDGSSFDFSKMTMANLVFSPFSKRLKPISLQKRALA